MGLITKTSTRAVLPSTQFSMETSPGLCLLFRPPLCSIDVLNPASFANVAMMSRTRSWRKIRCECMDPFHVADRLLVTEGANGWSGCYVLEQSAADGGFEDWGAHVVAKKGEG